MAGSAAGQPNRPDEPQCYNCGALGHWAIACPEPTRATPAGFETWRNTSSHAGHQGHHAKDHRGHKKSKGPVITRYAPPAPESAYSPQPAYYHGPSPYPPPPPVPSRQPPGIHHSPPAHYPPPPASAPPYSPQFAHPTPIHSPHDPLAAGYAPPSYAPTPPSGLPSRPEYGPLPPPPPGAGYPYQPAYTPYGHPPTQAPFRGLPPGPPVFSSMANGPPPRPPSGSPPHPKMPGNHPPPHAQPQKNKQSPGQNHKKSRRPDASSPKRPAPSLGPGPTDRIAHGLPPKPPPPNRDVQHGYHNSQHDHRNKRKQEDQKENRDHGHRERLGKRRLSNQNSQQQQRQQQHGRRPSQHVSREASHNSSPRQGVQKDAKRPESRAASEIGGAVSAASPDRRSQLGAAGIEPVPTRVLGKTNQEYGQKLVGNPGPRPQKSDLSLPEKPGIKPTKHGSIESIPKGTAKPDHKRNSVDRDGAFPTVPQSPSAHQRRDGAVQQRSNSYSVEERTPHQSDHRGHPKRKWTVSPPTSLPPQHEKHEKPPPPQQQQKDDQERNQESTAARGRETARPTTTIQETPRSRHPSVSSSSSRSSGLDSLDRELLGLESKESQQDGDDAETSGGTKPKRRRVQVDSAYSRRW